MRGRNGRAEKPGVSTSGPAASPAGELESARDAVASAVRGEVKDVAAMKPDMGSSLSAFLA